MSKVTWLSWPALPAQHLGRICRVWEEVTHQQAGQLLLLYTWIGLALNCRGGTLTSFILHLMLRPQGSCQPGDGKLNFLPTRIFFLAQRRLSGTIACILSNQYLLLTTSTRYVATFGVKIPVGQADHHGHIYYLVYLLLGCLSVPLLVCRSLCSSACQSLLVSMSVFMIVSACQSVSVSACQTLCLSDSLLVSLSACWSVSLSVFQSVGQSLCFLF